MPSHHPDIPTQGRDGDTATATATPSTTTTATPLSDDPHLSSAALCIKLCFAQQGGASSSLLLSSSSSRSSSSYVAWPEYTHQCFPEEWIRGYQPIRDDPHVQDVERQIIEQIKLLPSNSKKKQQLLLLQQQQQQQDQPLLLLLHPSHQNHDIHGGTAVQQLAITIHLAPSCQKCHVQLDIRQKSPSSRRTTGKRNNISTISTDDTPTNTDEESSSLLFSSSSREVKRIKGGGGDVRPISSSSSKQDNNNNVTFTIRNNSNQQEEVPPTTPNSINNEEHNKYLQDDPSLSSSTTTTSSCMTESEILQCLDNALPQNVSSLEDVQNDFLSEPLGVVLQEYSIPAMPRHHPHQKKKMDNNNYNSNDDDDNNNNNNRVDTTTTATLDFCLCLAHGVDTPSVGEYHSQVQKLALFWIETAENVDITNDQSGFWKVLYLFRKHSTTAKTTTTSTTTTSTGPTLSSQYKYSLAGFVTMFHFHAPFHKPEPGIIVRICQALILPPYQRQGHGKQMLQCIYDLAQGTLMMKDTKNIVDTLQDEINEDQNQDQNQIVNANDNTTSSVVTEQEPPIVLINVEDPAPAFVALRNKVDYWHIQNHREWLDPSPPNKEHHDNDDQPSTTPPSPPRVVSVMDDTFFTALPENQALSISVKSKIIPRQVHLVHEMFKLQALKEYITTPDSFSSTTSTTEIDSETQQEERKVICDTLEKRFRLMVKKRLNRECREELSAFQTVPEKQAFLTKEFDRQLKQYESILGFYPTENKS